MPYYECVNDKILLEALKITLQRKEHARGKGNVCKALKEGNYLKGLVDEDPLANQPSYYKKLQRLDSTYNINVYEDKLHNNILVELCPDLENWLINFFNIYNINFQKNNIPNNPERFKNLSNTQKEKVIELITTHSDKQEFQTLKQYL